MSTFNFLTCKFLFHLSEDHKFKYFSQSCWDIQVSEKIKFIWRNESPLESLEKLEDAPFRVILKQWGSKWQSCLPFRWSSPGGWNRGHNRIRVHWFWNEGLTHRLHTSTQGSEKFQAKSFCFALFFFCFVCVTKRNSF